MVYLKAETLAFIFGILGNIVSVGAFFAPMPTFYKIYKKKSSEGYQSIPYIVSLFSALMLLYYGSLKTNGILIITINTFGCAIETLYLIIYLVYAPKKAKNLTLLLLLLGDLGGFSSVMLLTNFLVQGSIRIAIIGWINAVINVCVFAAPLGVMRKVIKTKSVEFMPITLSLALTFNAIMWFFYGFFLKDYFIAAPNVIGVLLGMAQITLYMVYNSSSHNVHDGSNQNKLGLDDDSKIKSMNTTFNQTQATELKIVVANEVLKV